MEYISLLSQVLVHIIRTSSYDVCAVTSGGSYQPLDLLDATIKRLPLSTSFTIYRDTLPPNERCNLLVSFVHNAEEY